jgi:putative SOS response-associated peptidase YedK
MCARYTLTARPQLVAELFDLDLLIDIQPRYNVAPTQQVLALRTSPEGKREFTTLRWGLVPFWADDVKIGNKLLNARGETIFEKPSFRDAAKKRRCLIPADGFYEWRTENGKKQPYFIHEPGRKPFAFAGLWERWHGEDGKELQTCSIVTTDANSLLKPLHDRMPVILHKKDFSNWLDPALTDAKQLKPLLKPLPDEALQMYRVTPRMSSPRYDDPSCVESIDRAPPEKQGTLFE